MISANKAREISLSVDIVDEVLRKFDSAVNDAAMEGHTSVFVAYDNKLGKALRDIPQRIKHLRSRLEDLGYTITSDAQYDGQFMWVKW